MFECVETMHIVIDGLDEIDRAERSLLLGDLIGLRKTCPKVKLLLCNRKEFDISRVLKNKAKRLVVDRQNTRDIERFVESKINEWFITIANLDSLSFRYI